MKLGFTVEQPITPLIRAQISPLMAALMSRFPGLEVIDITENEGASRAEDVPYTLLGGQLDIDDADQAKQVTAALVAFSQESGLEFELLVEGEVVGGVSRTGVTPPGLIEALA